MSMNHRKFFVALLLLTIALAALACSDSEPATDGDAADGDTDGDLMDGDELDGDLIDGDEPDGDLIDGDEPDGDEDGDSEVEPLHAYDCLIDADCRKLLIVAHRGHHVTHPENSLASLRDAAAVGSHMVEMDVQQTADGHLVITHDAVISDVTDGSGDVTQMTWAEIQQLNLLGCEEGNPESCKIPEFSAVLALAKELGVMIYVDVKSGDAALILAAIAAGPYYEQALVRDDFDKIKAIAAQDDQLLIMPPVESAAELDAILAVYPDLLICEMASPGVLPEVTAELLQRGVKVQQDIMAGGDMQAELFGDYTGWKAFVTAGVTVLQSNLPHLLVPAANQYNAGGEFPDAAPGE